MQGYRPDLAGTGERVDQHRLAFRVEKPLRLFYGDHELQEELTAAARPTGETVGDLIAGLDAITQAQIAHAANTHVPQQAAVLRFLRQQHDDVRNLILTYFFGWLPYPMP